MAEIKQLKEKKTDEIFYPVTVGEAVIFEDGRSLKDKIDDLGGASYIETTYDNLKTLKHNSQLIPGAFYQITDYEYDSPFYESAEHQFDIVVQAISSNMLSEDARAVHHSGDTYFNNSDFDSWKLKYCLEPTKERFGEINKTIEGVVQLVKSPFYNNYNSGTGTFKEIISAKFPTVSERTVQEMSENALNASFVDTATELGWNSTDTFYSFSNSSLFNSRYRISIIYVLKEEADSDNITSIIIGGKTTTATNQRSVYGLTKVADYNAAQENDGGFVYNESTTIYGCKKGLIYEMIDEFGNNVDYDFKNRLIQYSGNTGLSLEDLNYISMEYPVYTFNLESYDENTEVYTCTDVSMLGNAKNNYIRSVRDKVDFTDVLSCTFFSSYNQECSFVNNKLEYPVFVGLYATSVWNTIVMSDTILLSMDEQRTDDAIHVNISNIVMLPVSSIYIHSSTNNVYFDILNVLVLSGCAAYIDSYLSHSIIGTGTVNSPEDNKTYINAVNNDLPSTGTDWWSIYENNTPRDVTSDIESNYTFTNNEWRVKAGLGNIEINGHLWYPVTINGIVGYRDQYNFFYYDSTQNKYYVDVLSHLTI